MGSAAVRMTVRWRLTPGEARSIASTLQAQMAETRATPGCSSCSLSTQVDAATEVTYVEEWCSVADLERQIRSRRFATLAELMERGATPPVVEFALPGGTRGLEYAQRVMASGRAADQQ